MAESTLVEMALEQPLLYQVEALLSDVRPLRGHFEELALELRNAFLQQGIQAPSLEAALDLQAAGDTQPLTVPFPLEIENAAVCLSDPLPLDSQALRQAVAAFRAGKGLDAAPVASERSITVVRLRVRGYGRAC